MLAIEGSGGRVAYRKFNVHSSEAGRFSLGPAEHAVLDVDGWRLGLAICRDTGIPRHRQIEEPYDSLSFVPTILDLMGMHVDAAKLPGRPINEVLQTAR